MLRATWGVVENPVQQDELRARVDALVDQGRALRRHDYEQLRVVAEEAFELACQSDSAGPLYPYGMATALSLLAHRNCMIGEWGAAVSEATQGLALLESDRPDLVRGELYDSLGWARFRNGAHTEALDYLMMALAEAEQIGDRSLQAYVLDRIANVYSSFDTQVDAALEIQDRALKMHRELGDRMGEATVLNNRAYTLIRQGDLDAALETAQAALQYAQGGGRDYLLMAVLDTIAEVHLLRDELDEAKRCTLQSLSFAEELDSKQDEANSLLSVARIELRHGDPEGARAHALSALELFERLGANVELSECCRFVSEVLEMSGEFEGALAFFQRFHELREAHASGATEGRISDLRVGYELENARKDAEILRLHGLALAREVEESRIIHSRLAARASLDALTGLYNRGHLPVLEAELDVAATEGVVASLVILDVDRFKDVNDSHGHLAGDHVLIEIARQLTQNARVTDTPVRYGGDEFLVLLVGMDVGDAHAVAERLRRAVSGVRVAHGQSMLAVTVSIGVATMNPNAGALPDLIARADRALYAAKKAGRNRIFIGA